MEGAKQSGTMPNIIDEATSLLQACPGIDERTRIALQSKQAQLQNDDAFLSKFPMLSGDAAARQINKPNSVFKQLALTMIAFEIIKEVTKDNAISAQNTSLLLAYLKKIMLKRFKELMASRKKVGDALKQIDSALKGNVTEIEALQARMQLENLLRQQEELLKQYENLLGQIDAIEAALHQLSVEEERIHGEIVVFINIEIKESQSLYEEMMSRLPPDAPALLALAQYIDSLKEKDEQFDSSDALVELAKNKAVVIDLLTKEPLLQEELPSDFRNQIDDCISGGKDAVEFLESSVFLLGKIAEEKVEQSELYVSFNENLASLSRQIERSNQSISELCAAAGMPEDFNMVSEQGAANSPEQINKDNNTTKREPPPQYSKPGSPGRTSNAMRQQVQNAKPKPKTPIGQNITSALKKVESDSLKCHIKATMVEDIIKEKPCSEVEFNDIAAIADNDSQASIVCLEIEKYTAALDVIDKSGADIGQSEKEELASKIAGVIPGDKAISVDTEDKIEEILRKAGALEFVDVILDSLPQALNDNVTSSHENKSSVRTN